MCFKNLRFRIPELEVAIRKLIHHSVGTHLFEVTKLFYGIHIAPVNRSDTSFTVHGNAIGSVVCKDILPLSNMVLLQNMMEANAMIFDKFAVNKFSFYRFDGEKIASLEEYWGDDGPAPGWRLEKKLGRPIDENR